MLIVFLVSGLWHGASITFVVWGALNGIYQILEDVLLIKKLNTTKITNIIFTFITFCLICFSWIFFKVNTINDAIYVIKEILSINRFESVDELGFLYYTGLDFYNFILLMICIFIMGIIDYTNNKGISVINNFSKQKLTFRTIEISLIIVFILLFGIWGPEYNASSFIYFNF